MNLKKDKKKISNKIHSQRPIENDHQRVRELPRQETASDKYFIKKEVLNNLAIVVCMVIFAVEFHYSPAIFGATCYECVGTCEVGGIEFNGGWMLIFQFIFGVFVSSLSLFTLLILIEWGFPDTGNTIT